MMGPGTTKTNTCTHTKTEMWEQHLAGARRCIDCKMVYNPNMKVKWFYEQKTHTFTTKEIATFLLWAQLTKNKYRISEAELELMKKLQRIIQDELTTRKQESASI